MQTKPNLYRSRPLGMRLSEQEAAVVNAVAAETGLSASDVVRQALRAAYPAHFKRTKDKRRSKK
jgi:hypothetical protein